MQVNVEITRRTKSSAISLCAGVAGDANGAAAPVADAKRILHEEKR
jgi:hypothetical protein